MATSDITLDVQVDEDGTIHFGRRTVPTPLSISEKARQSLAIPRVPTPGFPSLDDQQGWRELIARTNGLLETSVGLALKRSEGRATVETTTVAGATVHVATPTCPPEVNRDRALITVHGGSFIFLAGPWARAEAAMTAAEWDCLTYGVDYRVPPDHPFPAAVDDVAAVYRHLLERYEPDNVAISGASAGGNIAAAAVLKARDAGLPLPGSLILDTPACDLTQSGDTFSTLRHIDARAADMQLDPGLLYANGQDPAGPYLSPIFADFTAGFPPTYIQTGTRDILLSSCVRLHRALRNAEIDAELHVWEGAPHSAFLMTGAPEEAEAHAERERFLAKHWGLDVS